MKRPRWWRGTRRVVQTGFFLLFFWLILRTNFDVRTAVGEDAISLPYPVSVFFYFDPLVAILTLLATGVLFASLLWSLGVLIPTILFGRFFCGWLCPMGTLNHWMSVLRSSASARKATQIRRNRYHPYQKAKYAVLVFVLGAGLLGSTLGGLVDPLCILARSKGTVVLPVLHTALLGILQWFQGLGWPPLGQAAEAVFNGVAVVLLPFRWATYQGMVLLALVFLAILVANRFVTRLWCRAVCPLGALLGVFSRFSLVSLTKTEHACTHCGKCVQHCQGGDNPEIGHPWHPSECHLCLNCVAECPENALDFRFGPAGEPSPVSSQKSNPGPQVGSGVSRRAFLLSVAGGALCVPLMRTSDPLENGGHPQRIRPPGSLAEDPFLASCIRCGQCMRVCPNNALHPALTEAGVEGLWTPVLVPRIGYCEPTCTLCGQVCPTGAIVEITSKEKAGTGVLPPVRLGTAFVDRGRCLPWAMGKPCIVCEEWCPTSPKAIHTSTEEITTRSGETLVLQRPHVDPGQCTGCGACEYACPVHDQRAIRVTSVGESRSTENRLLL
jgi:polyferredoxin